VWSARLAVWRDAVTSAEFLVRTARFAENALCARKIRESHMPPAPALCVRKHSRSNAARTRGDRVERVHRAHADNRPAIAGEAPAEGRPWRRTAKKQCHIA